MDVLIVDDESLARQRLVRMVGKIEGCRIVAQAPNAEEAFAAVARYDPDVVLLDVRMPGDDGLTLARKIESLDDPPAIIFCTAYDEYALDAFDTPAVGYLLKPVVQERLQQALLKAKQLNKVQRASMAEPKVIDGQRTHISANSRRGIELIPLDDVRCFCADQKYVTVVHTQGETLIDDTLKDLEQEFSNRLLRIHRNALVAHAHIEAMDKTASGQYQLRLRGVNERPIVSRRHVPKLREILTQL